VHHGVAHQGCGDSRGSHAFHRYISDRFLPDKAIDLIDEAAACLPHADRFPAREIDESAAYQQLEIERQALLKESDAHSKSGASRSKRNGGVEGRLQRAKGTLAGGERGH